MGLEKKLDELANQVSQVVLDKEREVRLAIACLSAGGHLLIEDVPGVGKTTMVLALAKLSGLEVKRIQFTVDLLPGDILGGPIFNQKNQQFEFYKGPIFAQMVLADELNRASPRTQGAFLQAMEENSVSIDGIVYDLPSPFFVIATQNPHQQLGTFPLPESQIDRFLMSIELNYAKKETELKMLKSKDPREKLNELKPILSTEDFIKIREKVSEVKVPDLVAEYISRLLEKSRTWNQGSMPLSTRAGLALIRAAKAWAWLNHRNYLRPDDVQDVMSSVFCHRLGGMHGIRKGREYALSLQRETEVPI